MIQERVVLLQLLICKNKVLDEHEEDLGEVNYFQESKLMHLHSRP
jgi:hypothetical protein